MKKEFITFLQGCTEYIFPKAKPDLNGNIVVCAEVASGDTRLAFDS